MNSKNMIIRFHHKSMTGSKITEEERQAHGAVFTWLVDNSDQIKNNNVNYDAYVQQCKTSGVKAYFTKLTFNKFFEVNEQTGQ